jgi:ADP-heptose:LPS heptosyltransferase
VRKIIVMRPGALGDALLAVPALAALRATWPTAHLTVIARPDVLPLLAASELADVTYPFDLPAWASLWSDAGTPDPLLVEALAGADALVAWLGDADGTLQRNAATLGVARVILAPGRPPVSGATEHAALYLLQTLARLGVQRVAETPGQLAAHLSPLRTSQAASTAAERRWDALGLAGGAVVALHPGSGGARKCWPPANFAALAGALAARGRVPLVIEGPADAETVRELLAAADARLSVLRDVAVEELAALLARCVAYVGNDSGVTHLAALTGCPTLALFGPSDPAVWSPVGRRVRVLRAAEAALAPMSALPLRRVERVLQELLLP